MALLNGALLRTVFIIAYLNTVFCQDRNDVVILSDENFEANSGSRNVDEIPEEILIQLNGINTTSDFIRRFFTPDQGITMIDSPISIDSRPAFNGTESPRRFLSSAAVSMADISQPANCQPEQQVVELEKPENSATMYWPTCVRVRRCGGCCTSKMLACKPLATSILNVTVIQIKYNPHNPNAFESQGKKVFSLEQHDRCACICREQEEDCDLDVQVYRANECRCACKAPEVAANCTGSKKIWDTKDCICKCRNVRVCSTGRYFNIITCRCETVRRSLVSGNLTTQNSTHLQPSQTALSTQ